MIEATGMSAYEGDSYFNGEYRSPHLYDPKNFTYYARRSNNEYLTKYEFKSVFPDDPVTANIKGQNTVVFQYEVPCSPTAALKLVKVDAEADFFGTVSFDMNNAFYSLEDPAVLDIIHQIQSLEHRIGLKVNPRRGEELLTGDSLLSYVAELEARMRKEVGIDIKAVSFDTTELKSDNIPTDPEIAGLWNAHTTSFADGKDRSKQNMSGDSNGEYLYGYGPKDLVDNGLKHGKVQSNGEWWNEKALLQEQRMLSWPEIQNNMGAFRANKQTVYSTNRCYRGDGTKPLVDQSAQHALVYNTATSYREAQAQYGPDFIQKIAYMFN